MTAPMGEAAGREDVEAILARHDIYGFNGSQIACQCARHDWRGFREHRAHLTDALAAYVAAAVETDRRERDGAICWDTTCLNCSRLLDELYDADMTVERVREVRAQLDLVPHPQEPHIVQDIAEALDLALRAATEADQ